MSCIITLVMRIGACLLMDEKLVASYLGPSTEPAARTADAVVILQDGELPVHSARLCFGVLADAVALALDGQQTKKPLQISVHSCCKADFIHFLRLVYSLRPDQAAKTMEAADLITAGLIAHLCGFSHMLAVVEDGILGKFARIEGKRIEGKRLTRDEWLGFQVRDIMQQLLDYADMTKSENIARMCGVCIASQDHNPSLSFAMQLAFEACKKICEKEVVMLN